MFFAAGGFDGAVTGIEGNSSLVAAAALSNACGGCVVEPGVPSTAGVAVSLEGVATVTFATGNSV